MICERGDVVRDPYVMPGFELKARYQRNMLWGTGTVVLLALVLFAAMRLSEPESIQYTRRVPHSQPDGAAYEVPPGETQPEERVFRDFNPYERQHMGFSGMTGYRVVSGSPEPSTVETPMALRQIPALPDEDASLLYADIVGDTGMGAYFSEDAEYLPLTRLTEVITERDVQVVKRVDPEYPAIAAERGIEGQIAVVVYIDSAGQLSTYPDWLQGNFKTLEFSIDGDKRVINYAMSEKPPDWFFGSNFLRVLPQWEFLPRIDRGLAVGSVLTIKYYYCFGLNCRKYEITTTRL